MTVLVLFICAWAVVRTTCPVLRNSSCRQGGLVVGIDQLLEYSRWHVAVLGRPWLGVAALSEVVGHYRSPSDNGWCPSVGRGWLFDTVAAGGPGVGWLDLATQQTNLQA